MSALYKISELNHLSARLYRLVLTYGGVLVTLIVLNYLLKISEQISRIWSVAWFGLALLLLMTMRIVVWRMVGNLYRAGKFATPVAIIGSRSSIRHLIEMLSPELGKSVDLVGVFDAEQGGFGVFEELARVSRVKCIDEVLIPLPWVHSLPLESLLNPLRNLPVTVRPYSGDSEDHVLLPIAYAAMRSSHDLRSRTSAHWLPGRCQASGRPYSFVRCIDARRAGDAGGSTAGKARQSGTRVVSTGTLGF